MAGLFDRIGGRDSINIHHFVGGIKGYGTQIWDRAQALAAVNELLTRRADGTPLDAAQQIDFAAIADVLDAQPSVTAKLVYGNTVEAVMIATEAGLLDDATFRAKLGIA